MKSETWVFLRGLIRESRHWGDFPAQWVSGRPQALLALVDLPGTGVLHADASPSSMAAMLEHVRGQLRARGLQPPYHVMALSLGGMVAIQWLATAPEELAAVVLMNTSAAPFNPPWARLRPANYLPLIWRGLLRGKGRGLETEILSRTTNLLPAAESQGVLEQWLEIRRSAPVSRGNTWRQLLAALRFRAPNSLPPQVPVLLLSGRRDRLVDPVCSHVLSSLWGRALRVHPAAGHDLTLDAPDWVQQTVQVWLAEKGPRPAELSGDEMQAPLLR